MHRGHAPIGDNFVGVHVALRARASLPNDERKVIVQFAFDNLVYVDDDNRIWRL
jgi:hypothetical protein